MNKDLNAAITLLEQNHSIALCKGEASYTSDLRGVAPMLDFIGREVQLDGFSAADKIVGKAAAMLFAFAGVKTVYGAVMSRAAVETLERFGIEYSYKTLTDEIINRAGNRACPMEMAVHGISEPREAFEAIKKRLAEMKAAHN